MNKKIEKIVFAVDKNSFDSPDHIGVNKKVYSQINQMEQRGAKVVLEKYEWKDRALCLSVDEDTDVFYFRRMESSVKLLKKLKEIKEKCIGIKIIMEIPTYPFKGETGKRSCKQKLNEFISDFFLHKYIDQIVVCSPSVPLKTFKGIPVIEFRNGVDFENIIVNNVEGNDKVNIICVSGCTFSQGYDRIIKGLSDYYADSNNSTEVNLHIVGTGEYFDFYKDLAEKTNLLNKHIFIYGKKVGKELDDIYKDCNVALGHLATHRIGITISPALKIREYGARGLPIVSAPMLDIYNDDTKPYILKIEDDETNVNVNEIVDFVHRIYNEKEVNMVIRKKFEPYCDWKHVYKDVLECIFEE